MLRFKARNRTAGRATVLLLFLLVPALGYGAADDVERFEPLWVSGYGGGSVDYSPDGSRVAVGGGGVVFILDAASYQIERRLYNYPSGRQVKWSPNGRYVAAGSQTDMVSIWDADSGELRITLHGEGRNRVNSISWSPDSRRLASAAYDSVIHIWEVETGTLEKTIPVGGLLYAVAWSPDGRYLASGALGPGDGAVRIWAAQSGELIRELRGHRSAVTSVAWSPNSRYLASSGHDFDGTLKMWEMETGTLLWSRLPNQGWEVNAVVWDPQGNHVASASGSIRVWTAETGALVRIFGEYGEGLGLGISSVAWSPDGHTLASSGGATLYFWDYFSMVETSDLIVALRGHTGGVVTITWSSDGTYIASGANDFGRDRSIKIWAAETGSEIRTIRGDLCILGISSVAWSPSGRYLASNEGCGFLRIWRPETGEEVSRAERAASGSLAWSPDSRYLAAPDGDFYRQAVGVWEVDEGRLVRILDGAAFRITWSPDGRYLAAMGVSLRQEYHIRIWRAGTGELLRTIEDPHRVGVTALTWSPDSKSLASGGEEGTIKIWDIKAGTLVRTIESSGSRIWALSWRPDGRYLASAFSNIFEARIDIWEVATGKSVTALRGHLFVSLVKWSPDGRYLASSGDTTVRLWGVREAPATPSSR